MNKFISRLLSALRSLLPNGKALEFAVEAIKGARVALPLVAEAMTALAAGVPGVVGFATKYGVVPLIGAFVDDGRITMEELKAIAGQAVTEILQRQGFTTTQAQIARDTAVLWAKYGKA